jgi:hypothetical protein
MFFGQTESSETVHISRVAELAQDGRIEKITVNDDTLEITLDNGDTLVSRKEFGLSIVETLEGLGA